MSVWYIILLFFIFVIIGYILGSLLFGSLLTKMLKVDIRNNGSGNIGSTNVTRSLGVWAGLITFILDAMKGWFSILISTSIFVAFKSHIPNYNNVGFIIYISGFFAIVGHCYPITYLYYIFKFKFNFDVIKQHKGGKGAATTAGTIIAISPWIFIISFILFWIIFFTTRYVSLSSLIAIPVATILILIPNIDFLYMLNIFHDNSKNILNLKDAKSEFTSPTINYKNHWQYICFLFMFLFFNNLIIVWKHKDNIIRLVNKIENRF